MLLVLMCHYIQSNSISISWDILHNCEKRSRFSQLPLSWANMEMNMTSLQQYKDICVCTYKQKHHSCQQSWQIVCRCLLPRHLAPHDPVSLSENERLYHLDFYLPLIVYFSWKKDSIVSLITLVCFLQNTLKSKRKYKYMLLMSGPVVGKEYWIPSHLIIPYWTLPQGGSPLWNIISNHYSAELLEDH